MLPAVSSQVPNVPSATFISHALRRAPNQANSQSWIVPAPLVARCVSQPWAIIRSRMRRRAVAQQVRAVDQHHGSAAATGVADVLGRGYRALCHIGRHWIRRRVRIDEDVLHARHALPGGERIDAQSAQVQRRHVGLSLSQEVVDQRDRIAEIGNHAIGPGFDQLRPLLRMADARAVDVLVAADARPRCRPRCLRVGNLDRAVAKGEQAAAIDACVPPAAARRRPAWRRLSGSPTPP